MIKIGERFGNFLIQAEIGRGGMGTIYFAVDTMLNRDVALKVIHPQYSDNEQLMERFKIEAMTQARMNHPSIVLIFSFNHIDNNYAIAMEYIEGRSLKDVLQERGHLPPLEAMDVLEQILEGLGYAHSRNVIHRDIKPANILVSQDNRVKLSDFGIAKILGVHGLTKTGMLVGTPWYTSPEQIVGRDIDFRSDIYSLGITFYEMLTGRVPFDSETNSEFQIQKAHLETPPPRPSLFNPDISLKLEKFVLKALQKEVSKRFASAREMLVELRQLRRELSAATEGRTATESVAPLRSRRYSRRLFPAAILALAAFTLLGIWLNERYHFFSGRRGTAAETERQPVIERHDSSALPLPAATVHDSFAQPGSSQDSSAQPAITEPVLRGDEAGEPVAGKNPPAEPQRQQVKTPSAKIAPGSAPLSGPQPSIPPVPVAGQTASETKPGAVPDPRTGDDLATSAGITARLRELATQNRFAEAEQMADAYLLKPPAEQDVKLLSLLGAVKFIRGRFPAAEDLWRRAMAAQEWVTLSCFHFHAGPADRCSGQLRFRPGMLLFDSKTRPDHSFVVRTAQFRELLARPRRREIVLVADMNGQPLEWRLAPMVRFGRTAMEPFLVDFLKKFVF